jgi:hypothetical protein
MTKAGARVDGWRSRRSGREKLGKAHDANGAVIQSAPGEMTTGVGPNL